MIVLVADILGICVLIAISRIKDEIYVCLSGLTNVLLINLLINSLTVFLYNNQGGVRPGLLKNLYYLGYDNLHIIYLLPYIAISIFLDKMYYGRTRRLTIIFHLVFIITSVICMSATTIIILILFYLLSFYSKCNAIKKLLNEYFIIGGAIFVFVVYVLREHYEKYIQLFVNLFGKNLKSGRERIWILYEKAIGNGNIIIGHGYMNEKLRESIVGVMHAHNMYLDLIFEIGIIGLAVFLIITAIGIKAGRATQIDSIYILISAIVCFLVGFQVEAYRKTYFIMLIAVIYEFSMKYREDIYTITNSKI